MTMVVLSELAQRLQGIAAELVGAEVCVDVSFTVTAALGTLAEAVAESPELALAEFLVNVLEDQPQTVDHRPLTAPIVEITATEKRNGSRPVTAAHLERMAGMTERKNAEIAEELGLPLSAVAYHMGKIRKAARPSTAAPHDGASAQDDNGVGEERPFRG
jgi:hypothetical protein